MYDTDSKQQSFGMEGARSLSITTNSRPMMNGITPRWLLKMLPWVEIKTGTYRVPRRKIMLPDAQKVRIPLEEVKERISGKHLQDVVITSGLEMSLLDELASQFELEEFPSGEFIFREGDPGDKFYIIVKGKVEISKVGSYRNKIRLAILGDGDVFGEIALLENVDRTATVKALTSCYALTINSEKFQAMVARSPIIRENMIKITNERRALLNEINEYGEKEFEVAGNIQGESGLPETFVEYDDIPKEYVLNIIQTVLKVNTRLSDVYNQPFNQLEEQLRLTIEAVKERQEWELINNDKYGLLNQVIPSQQLQTRIGPPLPDDLDELLAKVWKEPAFFLAHPKAIAAFGREATRRGVPPVAVQMYGSPFITWRGVPIIPCDKLLINGKTRTNQLYGTTNILLMRVGEEKQGVVGLLQSGLENEQSPGLSVRYMGMNANSIASYLVSTYFNSAVLTDDSIAVLKDVEIGNYYDYELFSN